MQVTKEQLDPCTVELAFTVEAEAVSKAFGRAYREFGAFTAVPGFRPGKAPRSMVEKFVNHERLKERVAELLAVSAYHQALKDEDVTPYGDPDVDFGDLTEGEEWQFKAVVATPPSVVLGDYSDIAVERPVFPFSEEDIDAELEGFRREYGRQAKVEGRPVKAEDWVIAETSVSLDGETPPEPKRTLIRLGNNIPGFDEAIIGQEIDEERAFSLSYPDDYQEEDRRGKTAHFTARVVSISEKVLPDLNDEFATTVSGYATLEEWRAAMRAELQKRMVELANQVAEGRIVEALVQGAKLEYPGGMVYAEALSAMRTAQAELKERGVAYEEYLNANNLTEEQHIARLQADAQRRVESRLVMRELMKAEKLGVTDEDVDAQFDAMLAHADPTDRSVKRLTQNADRRNAVASQVLQEKLRERLMSLAKITDVPIAPKS